MLPTLLFLNLSLQAPAQNVKPGESKLPHTDLHDRIGQEAPDFKVIGTDGKTIRLRDLRGKTVVLDFWATWCQPCLMSMPGLEKMRTRAQGQDVVFLSVNEWDDRDLYEKWMKENAGSKYSFTFAFDPSGKDRNKGVAPLFGAWALPTLFVIDKTGKIAEVTMGYYPVDQNRTIEVKIEAALTKDGVKLAGAG